MAQSFRELSLISDNMLEKRLETVRELQADDKESYDIVKDKETGEHYLLYTYIHLNIQEGGARETYSHLMPSDSDDVLALLFGEQPYGYPEQWKRPYLRNGGGGDGYVWFDPGQPDSYKDYEQVGETIRAKLETFKREGKLDEESVRKLMEEIDRTGPPREDSDG